MKGVILAGGLGTRLRPLTLTSNKHLLPVYDKQMILYPIDTLVKADIKDVLIVTGGDTNGFLKLMGNGKKWGLESLHYTFQEGEGGISDALSLAEDFADGEPITVILGDNCTDANIKNEAESFTDGAKIFLKEVNDPERFGVPTFDDSGNILGITEKPSSPMSRYAVTGLYIYDNTVFRRIRSLVPSGRGELEVTDLNTTYLKDGKLDWELLNGFWSDAGTFETLAEVNMYWANKARGKERG